MMIFDDIMRIECDYCNTEAIIKYENKDLCLQCSIIEGVEI